MGVTDPISNAGPSAVDARLTTELESKLQRAGMYEPQEEALQREEVLGRLDSLVKKWVRGVSAAKGFTEPTLSEVRKRPTQSATHRVPSL